MDKSGVEWGRDGTSRLNKYGLPAGYYNLFYLPPHSPISLIVMTVISGEENIIEVGDNTTLHCNVSGIDDLDNLTENYVWRRDSTIIPGKMESSLMLDLLTTGNSGNYTCTVTISHNFLSNNITVTSTTGYSITVSSKH